VAVSAGPSHLTVFGRIADYAYIIDAAGPIKISAGIALMAGRSSSSWMRSRYRTYKNIISPISIGYTSPSRSDYCRTRRSVRILLQS